MPRGIVLIECLRWLAQILHALIRGSQLGPLYKCGHDGRRYRICASEMYKPHAYAAEQIQKNG